MNFKTEFNIFNLIVLCGPASYNVDFIKLAIFFYYSPMAVRQSIDLCRELIDIPRLTHPSRQCADTLD